MTLRELMTKEIKDYGWTDSFFKRGDHNASKYNSYEAWLDSLDDEEFLARYNDVRETINNLD